MQRLAGARDVHQFRRSDEHAELALGEIHSI
jgi:hypothetical protein